jgi:putative ABC transport system substrate-binding protein
MLPITARTQQPAKIVIGYFSGRSAVVEAPIREPLLRALEGSGYAVGRNVAIEYRFAGGRPERLPVLAAELVRLGVVMLIATDGGSALAATGATATIPIVFTIGFDPVQIGLAAMLQPARWKRHWRKSIDDRTWTKTLGACA